MKSDELNIVLKEIPKYVAVFTVKSRGNDEVFFDILSGGYKYCPTYEGDDNPIVLDLPPADLTFKGYRAINGHKT